MTYFAKVIDGRVHEVIVADQAFVDSGAVGDPTNWITSPRKRSASAGDTYRADIDAFVPEQPFASWILDTQSAEWQPPVPRPAGYNRWDESTTAWIEVVIPS